MPEMPAPTTSTSTCWTSEVVAEPAAASIVVMGVLPAARVMYVATYWRDRRIARTPLWLGVAPHRRPVRHARGTWTSYYFGDRKSTRLNSSHANISYAVF